MFLEHVTAYSASCTRAAPILLPVAYVGLIGRDPAGRIRKTDPHPQVVNAPRLIVRPGTPCHETISLLAIHHCTEIAFISISNFEHRGDRRRAWNLIATSHAGLFVVNLSSAFE